VRFRLVATARGADRRDLAVKFGTYIYVDSLEQNAAEALQKLGAPVQWTPAAKLGTNVG
jgi:hypothetical protein